MATKKSRVVLQVSAFVMWVVSIVLIVGVLYLSYWRLVSDAPVPLKQEPGRDGAEAVAVAVFLAAVVSVIATAELTRRVIKPPREDSGPYQGHWLP
jgi:hypothetical protein